MTPAELGPTIVHRYVESYRHGAEDATQSAIDLGKIGDLAQAAGSGRIADACRDIQRLIDGHEVRSPIIAEAHVGQRMAPARGLSIGFPAYRDGSVFYRELYFARRTCWAEFLDPYLGNGRTREPR